MAPNNVNLDEKVICIKFNEQLTFDIVGQLSIKQKISMPLTEGRKIEPAVVERPPKR
jgi:hypothetical protein